MTSECPPHLFNHHFLNHHFTTTFHCVNQAFNFFYAWAATIWFFSMCNNSYILFSHRLHFYTLHVFTSIIIFDQNVSCLLYSLNMRNCVKFYSIHCYLYRVHSLVILFLLFLLNILLCFSCICRKFLNPISNHFECVLIIKQSLHLFVASLPIIVIKDWKCVWILTNNSRLYLVDNGWRFLNLCILYKQEPDYRYLPC